MIAKVKFTESPFVRRAIRSDFPRLLETKNVDDIIKTIEAELAKTGLTLRDAEPINIAFPQQMGETGNRRVDDMRGIA